MCFLLLHKFILFNIYKNRNQLHPDPQDTEQENPEHSFLPILS